MYFVYCTYAVPPWTDRDCRGLGWDGFKPGTAALRLNALPLSHLSSSKSILFNHTSFSPPKTSAAAPVNVCNYGLWQIFMNSPYSIPNNF